MSSFITFWTHYEFPHRCEIAGRRNCSSLTLVSVKISLKISKAIFQKHDFYFQILKQSDVQENGFKYNSKQKYKVSMIIYFPLPLSEMVYSHYYRYYKKRVTPKVDPKIVVAVSITVISLIQVRTNSLISSQWHRH